MDEATTLLHYEIRIRGHLSPTLLAAFPALHATVRHGETVLIGALADQSALFGVLAQIESLGLDLLELRRESAFAATSSQPCDECSC
jgi:hypothetical protein